MIGSRRPRSGRPHASKVGLVMLTVFAVLASACGSGSDATTEPTAEQSAEEPTEPTAEQSAEEPPEPPAEQPAEEPTEPTAEQPAEEPPEPPAAEPTEPPAEEPAAEPDEAPFDPGVVVAVSEEGVLADLLALGVPVAASSATVVNEGFQGMDTHDTSGIEIFDYLTLSLEDLATYRADYIVTWEFIVGLVGEEQLSGLGAELVILPDGSIGPDRLRLLGEVFDREPAADVLLDELDAAYDAALDAVPAECEVSVVAVYAGANVAAFARPIWEIPRALDRLGCALVPGAEIDTDGNGRAWLSLEQLDLLAAPKLLMMQTDTVEGERDSIDEVTGNPIWQQLPAVESGGVVELDRLGYPGVTGEIRLLDDLVAALGD